MKRNTNTAIHNQINTPPKVLVLGGTGFIGQYIAKHLRRSGADVVIASRTLSVRNRNKIKQVRFQDIINIQQCLNLIDDADVVINAVGILRQRKGETYEHFHHIVPSLLAKACSTKDIRFIHVSALGLENAAKSKFIISKRNGEQAIQTTDGDWAICQAALVDGEGGYGAKWLRRVSHWPFHFGLRGTNTKLSPIHVDDLGKVIARISLKEYRAEFAETKIFELGGTKKFTLKEYLQQLNGSRPRPYIPLPLWLVRLASHLLDYFHLTPLSYGHYELLRNDNYARKAQAYRILNSPLKPLGADKHDTIYKPFLT